MKELEFLREKGIGIDHYRRNWNSIVLPTSIFRGQPWSQFHFLRREFLQPCRICRVNSKDFNKYFTEEVVIAENLLRNELNYAEDVRQNDSQRTGMNLNFDYVSPMLW